MSAAANVLRGEAELRVGEQRQGVGDCLETPAFVVTGDGEVLFDAAPAAGVAVRAAFRFDVPVRFAEDRLQASRATFLAGALACVPLVRCGRHGDAGKRDGGARLTARRGGDAGVVLAAGASDGVVIGLTSHDRDLLVGGLLYRAAPEDRV